jgi:hypothetical protein
MKMQIWGDKGRYDSLAEKGISDEQKTVTGEPA